MRYKSPDIHRTPLYRAKSAYSNMKRRCKGGKSEERSYNNVELKMTLDEFLTWSLPLYEDFQNKYPDKVPVVSRKNDSGNYEIGNIDIISKEENNKIQKYKTENRIQEDGSKKCSRCNTKYYSAEENFNKNKSTTDGYCGQCKKCSRLSDKKYKERKKNNKTS